MKILGIETSCDETAAAVVEMDEQTRVCRMLSNTIVSQIDIHKAYGGVVPEIAARSHIEAIIPVIDEALKQSIVQSPESVAKGSKLRTKDSGLLSLDSGLLALDSIDAIAVTYGAGLGGSLLIGVMTARSLAIATKKPLYAINHVEAHVYANFITQATPSLSTIYQLPISAPKFPILALIVSGGHTQLVLFKDHFDYQILGKTQDDAIGEAFDKVAKMIGLPYPGGPSVAQMAKSGDPHKFKFPKARMKSNIEKRITDTGLVHDRSPISDIRPPSSSSSYDFSFSGLKTAVLRTAQGAVGHNHTLPSSALPGLLSEAQNADIAASFQRVAIETVVDKTVLAFNEYSPASVVIAGGVASSEELRRQLSEKLPINIEYTDRKLCTDNASMIAALGCFKALLNQEQANPFTLEVQPNLKM